MPGEEKDLASAVADGVRKAHRKQDTQREVVQALLRKEQQFMNRPVELLDAAILEHEGTPIPVVIYRVPPGDVNNMESIRLAVGAPAQSSVIIETRRPRDGE